MFVIVFTEKPNQMASVYVVDENGELYPDMYASYTAAVDAVLEKYIRSIWKRRENPFVRE